MKNEFLKEMQARGFLYQCSNMDGLGAALDAGMVTAYWGTDPTGDSLHVGHVASLMMMRWFQKFGHSPITLVGGATGRIGDPSGRDTGRPMLSDADIEKNCDGLKKSISKFIKFGCKKTDAIMVDNNDWMQSYNHLQFLRDFGTAFTVPHMLSMDSVKRRLETGMTFLEFNYMTFQAVDFLELYKSRNCILQFCGADQWGNCIMGIDLIRKKLGKEAFVLSTSLITDSNGNKIGKSGGNAVWVNAEKTSPYEYYQYFRNTPDDLVEKFLKIFTEIPLADIEKLAKLSGAELNDAKKILAFCATEIAHGTDTALSAEATSAALFGGAGDIANAPSADYKFTGENPNVVDFVTAVGLFPSKSEARRMIDGGGLTINDKKVLDANVIVAIKPDDSVMLKRGKKTYLKVNVK